MDNIHTSYYKMDIADLEAKLETSASEGISTKEALHRLEIFGENALSEEKRKTIIDKIVDELRSPLTFVLLLAGIVTLFLGEYVDATVIFIALSINIAINLYQEGRASSAFKELKSAQAKTTLVIRGGFTHEIPTEQLVPGDCIILQSGSTVPADARVVSADNAEVNESVLTGEWLPVAKTSALLSGTLSRLEQKNMLYMGTLVTTGSIRAIVVETGDRTVFGGIGMALKKAESPLTPIQQNIKKVAKFLSYVIVVALSIVLLLGIYRGIPLTETVLIAIAIAVAAIPEGLPAVVSVMLAMSMQRVLKRGGLVRNLVAAETLGSTTVIMTDKTGTLTEGIMKLDRVVAFKNLEEDLGAYNNVRAHEEHGDERDVLTFAYLASNSVVETSKIPGIEPKFHGKPVDIAIGRAVYASGISVDELAKDFPRVTSQPFMSEMRMAFSLNAVRGLEQKRLFVLGAPEELLSRAKSYYVFGKAEALTDAARASFLKKLEEGARLGMRVVSVGYCDTGTDTLPSKKEEYIQQFFEQGNFVFCGLVLLHDPIRSDVRASIAAARGAGVRVLMATGDNPETARSIAQKAGIVEDAEAPYLLGIDVDSLSDEDLLEKIQTVSIYARMLPEQKQRIATLLGGKGEVVAMTGDGVNDAPSLRTASIGIALGSGTDVAKEASDLVLVDNSFTVIVNAIEEGRRAIDNIRKSIVYLISTSFSEIVVVIVALGMGLPLPLLPTQIIWTNMLTEGLMNFAFAFEHKEQGIMKRDPRVHGSQFMLSKQFIGFILTVGLLTGILLMWLFLWMQNLALSEDGMRTVMFVALTLFATLMSFSLRDLRSPIWKTVPWSNGYLLLSILSVVGGLSIALFVPQVSRLLALEAHVLPRFVPYIFALTILLFVGVELAKKFILKHR